MEYAKIEKLNCDILGDFQTLCLQANKESQMSKTSSNSVI